MDIDTLFYKIYCFFASQDNPKYWIKRRKHLNNQYYKKASKISVLFPEVKKIRVDYEQEYYNKNYSYTSIEQRTPSSTNKNEYSNFESTKIITSGFFELGNYMYKLALWKDEYAEEKRDDNFICHIKCANPTCIGQGFYLDDIITKAIKSKETYTEGEIICQAGDNHFKDRPCNSLLRYKIHIEYHTDMEQCSANCIFRNQTKQ